MAISRAEEQKYLTDLFFAQERINKPYTADVIKRLEEKNIQNIKASKIYNIMNAMGKDRKVLDAILEVIEERTGAKPEQTEVNLSKLNLQKP